MHVCVCVGGGGGGGETGSKITVAQIMTHHRCNMFIYVVTTFCEMYV